MPSGHGRVSLHVQACAKTPLTCRTMTSENPTGSTWIYTESTLLIDGLCVFHRIIPACAGSTSVATVAIDQGRDHPRLRGEHSVLAA